MERLCRAPAGPALGRPAAARGARPRADHRAAAMLLLDEPLSALDPFLRVKMRAELKRLQRELGISFIHVTHSQEEAMALSDLVVVMNDGRIEQAGTPREVFQHPGAPSSWRASSAAHNVIALDGGKVAVRTDRLTPHRARPERPTTPAAVIRAVEYQGTSVRSLVARRDRRARAPGPPSLPDAASSNALPLRPGEAAADRRLGPARTITRARAASACSAGAPTDERDYAVRRARDRQGVSRRTPARQAPRARSGAITGLPGVHHLAADEDHAALARHRRLEPGQRHRREVARKTPASRSSTSRSPPTTPTKRAVTGPNSFDIARHRILSR